jgi:hypothetical protein
MQCQRHTSRNCANQRMAGFQDRTELEADHGSGKCGQQDTGCMRSHHECSTSSGDGTMTMLGCRSSTTQLNTRWDWIGRDSGTRTLLDKSCNLTRCHSSLVARKSQRLAPRPDRRTELPQEASCPT